VVLESLKERQTLTELCSKFEIHSTQIANWRKEFLNKCTRVFGPSAADKKKMEDNSKLYEKIGRLEVERDFLKKNLDREGIL